MPCKVKYFLRPSAIGTPSEKTLTGLESTNKITGQKNQNIANNTIKINPVAVAIYKFGAPASVKAWNVFLAP